MKLFTKLALVSAIAVSGQAMAMQSLDDAALSATTGQDGITLRVNTTAAGIDIAKLIIHDNDGLNPLAASNPNVNIDAQAAATTAGTAAYEASIATAADPANPTAAEVTAAQAASQAASAEAYQASVDSAVTGGASLKGGTGNAGAIVVNGVNLKVDTANASATLGNSTLAKIDIDSDAGAGSASPFLNIGASTNALAVHVGSIGVAASNTGAMLGARRGVTNEVTILGDMDVNIGASNLNIQLGNQPQGALIKAQGTITNGITISGLELKDNQGGGSIGIDSLKITSANNANLNVDTKIKVLNGGTPETTGLQIASTGANDIYMSAVRLGNATAASIGAVEIQGINMNGSSIMVSGH